MKPAIYILILMLCNTSALGRSRIFFKNGDVLTGIIESRSGTEVTLKTDTMGTLLIPAAQIEQINPILAQPSAPQESPVTTPPHDFTTPPEQPQTQRQTAVTQPQPGDPTQPPKKPAAKTPFFALIPIAEINKNPIIPPPKIQDSRGKWSGRAEIALSLEERSNIDNNGKKSSPQKYDLYKVHGQLGWKKSQHDLKWSSTYRYRKSEIRIIDDFFNLSQDYRNNLSDTYYAKASSLYQEDYAREIDQEFLQSAELGITWYDTKKFKLTTSAGGAYHQFDRTSNSSRGSSAGEGKFIFDQTMRWQVIDSLAFTQSLNHLGNLDNYRFIFRAGVENKLVYDLFFKLEYRLDRDTDTTYRSRGYEERRLISSLFYKF
jgi:hypothetical protein